jgi:hypothetical protein
MDPVRELDDVVGAGGVSIYHKSLLYLVSRGFERPAPGEEGEVPIVGMAHFAESKVSGTSFATAVEEVGGDLVWSPDASSSRSRSDSSSHGGFDDDSATMTSVLLRILGQEKVEPGNEFAPNLATPAGGSLIESRPTALEDQPPEIVVTEVKGQAATARKPHGHAAAAQATTGSAARRRPASSRPTSRVLAALEREGWTEA